MAETIERTETSKKGISDPFKEFKIVGFSGSVEDWPKGSKKFMAKDVFRFDGNYVLQE